jgi:Flp pilus assembly protein TadG
MLCSTHRQVPGRRQGAAAVELAVLLPVLGFLFICGVDFARVFYHHVTITNCARNGAVYGSTDATYAANTAGIQAAALQDATNLSPTPTVSSTTGTNASGKPYVRVTVTYPFLPFASYPGYANPITITRTIEMRVAPLVPSNS